MRCHESFEYYLVHNGFNSSCYSYCDKCGRTVFVYGHGMPGSSADPFDHKLGPSAESVLPPCSCGGRFRADAGPRCPKCRLPISAEEATSWLEAQALGTKGGWRWQQAWHGLYSIVINQSAVDYQWDDLKRAV